MRGDRRINLLVFAFAILQAGCETTSLSASLGASPNSAHAEPPIEIYSRIARGALACWFGAQGSLKKSHIFNADVAPETAGGGAEIVIHERDPTADNPRSFRAYKVAIGRSGDGSNVQVENMRMPVNVAKDMDGDVLRWSKGQVGCSVVGTGGWAQQPNLAPVETGTVAAKKKPGSAKN